VSNVLGLLPVNAGGEDDEDVDQDINLIEQEAEILELFKTFSFK
jgi:hypothetical protein